MATQIFYIAKPENAAIVLKNLIYSPHCLALTQSGFPGHPLYLKANLKPFRVLVDPYSGKLKGA